MHSLRRFVVILVLACVIVGSHSIAGAYNLVNHVPAPLASVDAAVAAIKDLKGFLVVKGTSRLGDLSVDELGLKILYINEGVKTGTTNFWVGWDHIKIPNNTPYREDTVQTIVFNNVKNFSIFYSRGNAEPFIELDPHSKIWIDDIPHGRKFIDAVATLALAQNAVLEPYYNIDFYDGKYRAFDGGQHEGLTQIQKSLKAAKVAAGAVVCGTDQSEAGRGLMDLDVIVQVTYGEKIYPISSKATWDAASREALAGKPEATLAAKVIRNGVLMDREVKVYNIGFGVTVAKSTSAVSQTQAVPPRGFGISLRPIEAEEAKTLGLPNANGFMVLSLAKDGSAERMQIKPNDILLAINGVEITSAVQLQELVAKGPVMSAKVFRAGAVVALQAPLVL